MFRSSKDAAPREVESLSGLTCVTSLTPIKCTDNSHHLIAVVEWHSVLVVCVHANYSSVTGSPLIHRSKRLSNVWFLFKIFLFMDFFFRTSNACHIHIVLATKPLWNMSWDGRRVVKWGPKAILRGLGYPQSQNRDKLVKDSKLDGGCSWIAAFIVKEFTIHWSTFVHTIYSWVFNGFCNGVTSRFPEKLD